MYVDKVPALETGRFTDLNLLGAYLAGERDPVRCAQLIEQDDLLDPAFLQSIVDGSIAGLAQREKHGDSRGAMSLGCADYIAEHFRSRQLFFTLNHPAREILCHLADQALRLMGVSGVTDRQGPEPLTNLQYPIYRSVKRAFGFSFPTASRYKIECVELPVEKGVASYLTSFAGVPPDQLAEAYAEAGWILRGAALSAA